ncbi:uncharacterized protein CCOS01_01337 [Colletotrichum costaricense]|uniref:Uncharacterized protein n=1 Tax=Colletotrichum costaricense TaxID=1209916 RepID=A0AAI9ZB81_9PEZI|nr:uncharacterized protein CCOS01_01337 [Colletotrichum costaricense]KAK1540023.1 hypothetical protein CCOS01_01337 [Colletotrichum costaricense]
MASKINLAIQRLAMPPFKAAITPATRLGNQQSCLLSTTAALTKRLTPSEYRCSVRGALEERKTLIEPKPSAFTWPRRASGKETVRSGLLDNNFPMRRVKAPKSSVNKATSTEPMQSAIIPASPIKMSILKSKISSGYNGTLKMAKKLNTIPVMWKVAGLTTLASLGTYGAIGQYQAMLEAEARKKRIAEENEAWRRYEQELWEKGNSISPASGVLNDGSYPFALFYH